MGKAFPKGTDIQAEIEQLRRENSELKAGLEALGRAEFSFWAMLAATDDCVFIKDRQGRYLLVNPAAERILGRPAREIMGRRAEDFFDADTCRQISTTDAAALRGETSDAEIDGNFGGRRRVLKIIKFPLRDLSDEVAGLCEVARDITQRREAELALGQSESMHRRLVELAPEAILVYADEKIAFVNPAGRRLLGARHSEDLIGRSVYEIIHPMDHEKVRRRLRVINEGQVPPLTEYRLAEGLRGASCVESAGALIDHQGRPAVLTIYRDITEKKRMEEDLRRSEEKFRRIVETANEGVIVVDVDFRIVFVNALMAEMLGYAQEEMIGRPVEEFVAPEHRADVAIQKSLRLAGIKARFERRLLRKDGQMVWTMVSATSLHKPDGQLDCSFAMYTDITTQKQVTAEMRRERAYFQQLLERLPEAVAVLDEHGRIVQINEEFTRLFGYTKDEARGVMLYSLVSSPEYKAEANDIRVRVLSGERLEVETIRRRKDGSDVEVSIVTAPKIQDNKIVGLFALYRDIGPRKQIEKENQTLAAQLRQAQKMEAVGTLAGGVAHDFNNILAAVIGFTEISLLALPKDSPVRRNLERALQSSQRASSLVRQLLTFSRRVETNLKPLDINAEIRHAVEILERIIPKMVAMEMELAPDLPHVNGDPNQVEQVLINLATNAADAMPDGGKIVFETGAMEIDPASGLDRSGLEPGRHVVLRVTDTGHGMEAATMEKIFDPFFTTKGPGKGTGLGLSTVYGIVKSHGGQIFCHSRPGQGTRFEIFLPAGPDADVEQAGGRPPREEAPGGTETILLVDDEPSIRDLVEMTLGASGYTVIPAESGERALEIFGARGREIGLVILDMGMPGMGGQKCLRELMARDPGARVLVASGYAAGLRLDNGDLPGAAGFIAKPFRRGELLRKIRAILDGPPRRGPAS